MVQGHTEFEDINLCLHYYDYNFIKRFLSVFSMFNLNQRDMRRPGEQREEHIGRVLGNVAPSMLLCSLSESVCFFLGKNLPLILNSVSPHKTQVQEKKQKQNSIQLWIEIRNIYYIA